MIRHSKKNNLTIARNVSYISHTINIYPAYISKQKLNHENHITLLIINSITLQ